MMSLFASIPEALTAEFAPYLEHVIPPLIRSSQKQTVSISSAEASESEAAQQGVEVGDCGGVADVAQGLTGAGDVLGLVGVAGGLMQGAQGVGFDALAQGLG